MAANELRYYTAPQRVEKRVLQTDICVYGGTSGGVIAAVQARRWGANVVVIESSAHLGGLSAGGLGYTDIGHKAAIGGLSREFYRRVGAHYKVEEDWRFEPHVAEKVFNDMMRETETPFFLNEFLESITTENKRITSLTTESGLTVRAKMFIDATYEGDLMAKAGVSFHVGREANSVYNETVNGAQVHNKHQFDFDVDPYVIEGDPSSGLLPYIETEIPVIGAGDHRVQAYCFRMCLTKNDNNRIPFEKPKGYDAAHYQLLARYFAKRWNQVSRKFDSIRNDKTDTNNHGAVSTDFIGANYDYPNGDYATREKIFQAHVVYQKGLSWFRAYDTSVPKEISEEMSQWGLARDEFVRTGGWPHQLYVREARRMISDCVMTEHHCRGTEKVKDVVGLAAYTMDSHNCRRFVQDGKVRNEGDVQIHGFPPYPISYRSIVPKKSECENLLVPVCLAASHIAFGSIRMEPVFMVLGQSAAIAASLAMKNKCALQDLPYDELQDELQAHGQILVPPAKAASPQSGE